MDREQKDDVLYAALFVFLPIWCLVGGLAIMALCKYLSN